MEEKHSTTTINNHERVICFGSLSIGDWFTYEYELYRKAGTYEEGKVKTTCAVDMQNGTIVEFDDTDPVVVIESVYIDYREVKVNACK